MSVKIHTYDEGGEEPLGACFMSCFSVFHNRVVRKKPTRTRVPIFSLTVSFQVPCISLSKELVVPASRVQSHTTVRDPRAAAPGCRARAGPPNHDEPGEAGRTGEYPVPYETSDTCVAGLDHCDVSAGPLPLHVAWYPLLSWLRLALPTSARPPEARV